MKHRTNISINSEDLKSLKIKAIKADMTLSEMLVTAGTITPADVIKKHLVEDTSGKPNA